MDNREERIRRKAHELWERAGRPEGQDAEHWANAERMIDGADHAEDTDKLGNEPNPRGGIDIAPGPGGDIHQTPPVAGKRR